VLAGCGGYGKNPLQVGFQKGVPFHLPQRLPTAQAKQIPQDFAPPVGAGLPAMGCAAAPLPTPGRNKPQAAFGRGPVVLPFPRTCPTVTGKAHIPGLARSLWELACLRWAAKQPHTLPGRNKPQAAFSRGPVANIWPAPTMIAIQSEDERSPCRFAVSPRLHHCHR